MKWTLQFSAIDLAATAACAHHTTLDLQAAYGLTPAPKFEDAVAELRAERGRRHEANYIGFLKSHGVPLVELANCGADRAKDAMRSGAEAISQAELQVGRWHGRADLLVRVETPSAFGSWSYEVLETKLAMDTRAATILQLCLYSELLAGFQGVLPEWVHVVTPASLTTTERYRTRDYVAYHQLVRDRLQATVDNAERASTYPEPVEHCATCGWWSVCDRRRRADNHLSLVAGATRAQRRLLESHGVDTVEELARASVPFAFPMNRGSLAALHATQHQAALQWASRSLAVPRHDALLPIEDGAGFTLLPEPSPGDVFFDIEGDPFVDGGGLEYLFGWVVVDEAGVPTYSHRWGLDRLSERNAFRAFMDAVVAHARRYPCFHIYHFSPYEPAALKRLMGRHMACDEEVDQLLRARRFVDLHRVVRQAIRIGVERYALKELENVHGFHRAVELSDASTQLRAVERSVEFNHADSVSEATRATVATYNRDDCLSALSLRNWLEEERRALVNQGIEVPRPARSNANPPNTQDPHRQRIASLFERLTRFVPVDPLQRTAGNAGCWLLAHLLEWHRREDKATWWELFRLRGLSPDELLVERAGIAGLRFISRTGGTDLSPVHRYEFMAQDHDVRPGDRLQVAGEEGGEFGQVVAVDDAQCTVDVVKRSATRGLHPAAAFVHDYVNPRPLADSLERLARRIADHGLDEQGPLRATWDLLLRRPPRVKSPGETTMRRVGEDVVAVGQRLVLELERGVLPVQGPPGSGKTYLGARMVVALIRAGKRVGITAVSHKVIRNLVDAVLAAGVEQGLVIHCALKHSAASTPQTGLVEVDNNQDLLKLLKGGRANVAAATPWSWARAEFQGVLDVLVIDEAGQMSLPNALAVAPSAQSLVLLGDPAQLEQPVKGTHPDGMNVSALEHLLGDQTTLSDQAGLFLSQTRRLHPDLCRFTSEAFYDGRLCAVDGCERQALRGDTPFVGAGHWFVPVEHAGNQSSSPEEAAFIRQLVESLVARKVEWVDANGRVSRLTFADVLIMAPYNAQVGLIAKQLPRSRVGTVDKFQGQEAPVAIYSMTSSSAEDAPRGMEFLYSLNRFNVATSRARCTCIVVASPVLLQPACRTPQQMRLANALCRFAQLSSQIETTQALQAATTGRQANARRGRASRKATVR